MLDQNAREVISLKQSDLAKSHFSKAELERILKIYKICRQAQADPFMQKLYSGKLAWIAAAAQKRIKDFAEGRLSIDADATVSMNAFVGEFGRIYKHEGNVLKYVYTPEARQARIALAKAVYRQRIASEEAQTAAEKKVQHGREQTAAERRVVQPKVRRQAVSTVHRSQHNISSYSLRLRQASKQQKQKWLSKFKKSFVNASYPLNRDVKSIKNGIKIAALVGLFSYPLLSSLGKGEDTHVAKNYDAFVQTSKVQKSLERRDSLNLAAAEEECSVGNGSDLVSDLPENIFWTEYVPAEKKQKQAAVEDKQTVENIKPTSEKTFATDSISQEKPAEADIEKDVRVPYSEDYAKVCAVNDKAYKEFALTLTNQFLYNIAEVKSGRNLYREKEKLIGKYYAYNHIIPNRSCESMTFATFLDVLERDKNPQNYIHEACRDLLFQVSNPHGCYSNMHTFKGVSCKNLRKALSERLQDDEYGIYMVWIPRGGGKYHRQTVIGIGNGEAYLLAFNNSRAIKMDVDNLNKISGSRGYFANLGGKIFERANTLAIEDYKKQQILKERDNNSDYLAQVWNNKNSYSN